MAGFPVIRVPSTPECIHYDVIMFLRAGDRWERIFINEVNIIAVNFPPTWLLGQCLSLMLILLYSCMKMQTHYDMRMLTITPFPKASSHVKLNDMPRNEVIYFKILFMDGNKTE